MGNQVVSMCRFFKKDPNTEYNFEEDQDPKAPNAKSNLPKISESHETVTQDEDNKEFEIILSYIGRYIEEVDVKSKLSSKVDKIEQKLGPFVFKKSESLMNNFTKPYILFNEDQSIYKGGWINWNSNYEKHGHGVLISPDGSKFEGNWDHDEISGYGRYISSSGTYYEGKDK